MKQFNLEEYLENPSRKIITQDGRCVRIVCTDRSGLNVKPIVALITIPNGDEVIKTYWENGVETHGYEGYPNDLFFAPNKKVYPFKEGDRVLARDSDTSWNFDYFYSYREESLYPYMCRYAPYEQCIPLNEHTWKLLGTTDEYNEEQYEAI